MTFETVLRISKEIPFRNTSVNRTSPASRMWSFRSCHDPDLGKPETDTLYFDDRGSNRPPLPPLSREKLKHSEKLQIDPQKADQ